MKCELMFGRAGGIHRVMLVSLEVQQSRSMIQCATCAMKQCSLPTQCNNSILECSTIGRSTIAAAATPTPHIFCSPETPERKQEERTEREIGLIKRLDTAAA